MANTLEDVLEKYHVFDKWKKIAIAKLLAYRGCVTECNNIEFEAGSLIADEDALMLLDKPFATMLEGVEWLHQITEQFWFEDNPAEEDPALLEIYQALGLTNEVSFEVDDHEQHVVVYGDEESRVSVRLNFLESFRGKLYYLSAARRLNLNEPSLAAILAQWFQRPDSIDTIKSVISKFHDIYDNDDFELLKTEILAALDLPVWPNDLPDWPMELDMVKHLISERQQREPGSFNNMELIPVFSPHNSGGIDQLTGAISEWYARYGKALIDESYRHSLNVQFISSNHERMYLMPIHAAVLYDVISAHEPGFAEKLERVFQTIGKLTTKIKLADVTGSLALLFSLKIPAIKKSLLAEERQHHCEMANMQYLCQLAVTRQKQVIDNLLRYQAMPIKRDVTNAEAAAIIACNLVTQKDYDAAEFMLSNFSDVSSVMKDGAEYTSLNVGNSAHLVVERYMQLDEVKRADALILKYHATSHADECEIGGIRGLAYAGQFDEVVKRLEKSSNRHFMFYAGLEEFARGGHFAALNKLYQHFFSRFGITPLTDAITHGLTSGGYLDTRKSTLYTLAHIDDDKLRRDVFHNVTRVSCQSDEIFQAACRINAMMRARGVKYDVAVAAQDNLVGEMCGGENAKVTLRNAATMFAAGGSKEHGVTGCGDVPRYV